MKHIKHAGLIALIIALCFTVASCDAFSGILPNGGSTGGNSEDENTPSDGAGDTPGTDDETPSTSPSDKEDDKSQDTDADDTPDVGDDETQGDGTSGEDPSDGTDNENPDGTEDEIITEDPYTDVDKNEFYASYKPASSYMDAYYRSQHGLMSGSLEVPQQMFSASEYRPKSGGLFIRNRETVYLDEGNTYVVYDAYGEEVMRIYRGGAYITLEEVAAYMYAFGGSEEDLPANYVTSKSLRPTKSVWGEYLRLNHSYFSGSTTKYPYEPELPNIKGCGGSLQYYEMDIGTTGTTTPGYSPVLYNDGTSIERGAARLVYGRYDLNYNGLYDEGELYVFYTHNHYNDFTEYLNYYGGWGETFGNITGGGTFDSKTNYNPTPYPQVYMGELCGTKATCFTLYYNKKHFTVAA